MWPLDMADLSKWIYWYNAMESRTIHFKFRFCVSGKFEPLDELEFSPLPQLSGWGVEYLCLHFSKSEVSPLIPPPLLGETSSMMVFMCLRQRDHACLFVAVFRGLLSEGHVRDVPLGPSDWPLSGLYHHLPCSTSTGQEVSAWGPLLFTSSAVSIPLTLLWVLMHNKYCFSLDILHS